MSTKMTVVVDNIPQNDIEGEWGLCIAIEKDGVHFLVDTGASDLFVENMEKLSLDLESVEYAILSHAHYDHANGVPAFFEHNKTAKFYLRKGSEENCYSKKEDGYKYIGLPENVLEDYKDRIELVEGDAKICEGVYLIPHKTKGLEEIGAREHLYQKVGENLIADNFNHEQSLVLDTAKGLVIVNSCSHGGASNIIKEIATTFPEKQIYGMIGGFHLFNRSEEEVRAFAKQLKETNIGYICTGHCTAEKPYEILKEELGDVVHQLHVGLEMEF